jgi:hypothetical protein
VTIKGTAREAGISKNTVKQRITQGWDERQIVEFYATHKKVVKADRVTENIRALYLEIKLEVGDLNEFLNRMYKGDMKELAELIGITVDDLKELARFYARRFYLEHKKEIENVQN